MTLCDLPPTQSMTPPPLQWETIHCNLCGSSKYDLYHQENVPYFDVPLDFDIVRCQNCDLVYTNPRLTDYNANYLFEAIDADHVENHAQAKLPIFQSALKQILALQKQAGHPTGGNLLDLGCGSGHFLREAQKAGFTETGIEPVEWFAQYAKEKIGVNVLHEDIYTVELPQNHYDVITAWDVIEHVSDPKAMLARCAQWLKPGGILALRFPSSTWQKIKGVIFHQVLRSSRASFGPTMHLYFFSDKTIRKMTREVDLDVIKLFSTAAEANTENRLLNSIKRISHCVVRGIELFGGKSLGNLEVYCQKPKA